MKKLKIISIISVILVVLLTTSTIVLSVLLVNKKDKTRELSYFDRKIMMFEFENLNFAKEQIVFIGDSITDLCVLDDYYSDLPLATYNRGIGADTTEKVLNRLKVSLYDIQPSKVVLLIGVNDIIFDLGVNNLLLNYGIILNDINLNLPNTEVLCLSILPMNQEVNSTAVPNVEKSNQIIMDVNIEIEKIVDEYDYEFVNLFPEFADDNNYLKEEFSDDGLHLNHNGYVVLSNKLKPMLM